MAKQPRIAARAPGGDTVDARALIDLPAHGAKAGNFVSLPPEAFASLKAQGSIDDDPGAVAYAFENEPHAVAPEDAEQAEA